MKTLLLSLLIMVSSPSTWGQSINRSNHRAIDATYEMISIHSKSYYVEWVLGCCSNQFNLVAVNDSGNVIFRKDFSVHEPNYFKRIIRTKDNQVLVLSYGFQSCDVGGSKDFITKLDTNGNVMFQVSVQNTYTQTFTGEVLDVTQHPDSSFYLVTGTDLLHYTSGGQFISRVTTPFTGINSILALSNGHLLINGMMNAQLKNSEVTTGLTVINQQTTATPVVRFIQSNTGFLYARTQAHTIEKYNSALTLLAASSVSINALNYSINDFVVRNDSVFVTGIVSASITPFYAILDVNLMPLYQTQSNYKRVRPTGISITNKNKINVITTGSSETFTNVTFSGLYQFGRTGNFNSTSDIGVLSYTAISTSLTPHYSGPYAYYVPSGNFNVVIKNFGTDTVKQFYLNHFKGGLGCNSFFHKLYQATILPGGTLSVQTGTFEEQWSSIIMQNPQAYFAKVELCFFTTIPNLTNDIGINNDSFCDSTVFFITSLDENFLETSMITIFPNPAETGFTVSCDIPMHRIGVYTTLGDLVRQEEVNEREREISVVNLPSGLYFVRVETAKGTIIKKVLKN